MNWEEMSAIGQILGAVAVFISIGYLAIQVRTSNVTARHASQNAFLADYTRLLEMLTTHPEVADILRKSINRGWSSLTAAEQMRFHYTMVWSLMLTQNMYLELKRKQFDPTFAAPLISYFASTCKSNGSTKWWDTAKLGFDRGFVEHIDSLIKNPLTQPVEVIHPWYIATDG
jgi:hypothetical protein